MATISAERVEEVLMRYIGYEEKALGNVDALVDEICRDKAESPRIKRTLKSEYNERIKLLNEIREELLD